MTPGNCDIDFFNFCHCQARTLKILNQSRKDQNVAVNFGNHQKQKGKLAKYNEIEQNQSIIL
jgi:hypothetical protein